MQSVIIKALKADQSVHRYSDGKLELINDIGCVIWTEPGNGIYAPGGLLWEQDCLVRTLFVHGARLNLLEIHEPDSTPRQVYLNVIAPMALSGSEVIYVDHELDILRTCGERRGAHILDEDDFEAAVETYGYDQTTISNCRAAARLGKEVANAWEFGLPSISALASFAAQAGGVHA